MESENTRTLEGEATIVDVSSAPLTIPEPVRLAKPSKKKVLGKPPKKGRKKKHVKTEPKMTREELMAYFANLQTDPNFGLLPFPRCMIEQDPMKYAGEDPKQYAEKMKRLDFIYALENAKTEEERDALIAKRKKELEHQTVPAYQAVSAGGGNPYKG